MNYHKILYIILCIISLDTIIHAASEMTTPHEHRITKTDCKGLDRDIIGKEKKIQNINDKLKALKATTAQAEKLKEQIAQLNKDIAQLTQDKANQQKFHDNECTQKK